jgi:hypothetical protein
MSAHATVEVHLRAVADRLHDLGESLEGCDRAVELTTAVVGHDDAGRAVLAGQDCVLCRDEALTSPVLPRRKLRHVVRPARTEEAEW